jgi:phenylalanyl-tRNA synthetase beta chain
MSSEYSFSHGFFYSREKNQANRPVETPRLAGVCFGFRTEKHWQNASDMAWTLHDMLRCVQDIGTAVGIAFEYERLEDTHPMALALHPGRRVGLSGSLNNGLVWGIPSKGSSQL